MFVLIKSFAFEVLHFWFFQNWSQNRQTTIKFKFSSSKCFHGPAGASNFMWLFRERRFYHTFFIHFSGTKKSTKKVWWNLYWTLWGCRNEKFQSKLSCEDFLCSFFLYVYCSSFYRPLPEKNRLSTDGISSYFLFK